VIRAQRALVVVLLAAVALFASELVVGATHDAVEIANTCKGRSLFPGHGTDATIQRVVLDGLDDAACRLHTTREELVLSLDGKGRWDAHTIDVAIRAGLMRAVDDAERRGDIPGFLAPLVRAVVKRTPIRTLVTGGVRLGDLIG
jgi:hypothetical protein